MPGLLSATSRGAFIVFEGCDRCGKSTQASLLVKALQLRGIAAELWRFPDRTSPTGKLISGYLGGDQDVDDAAIHLLFSANRWEKRKRLLATLSRGVTLVVDRYAYSGAAYTAAKGLPGMGLEWAKAPDEGLPAPDLVLLLQLGSQSAQARDGYGGERYERPEFQERVAEQFEALQDDTVVPLDASQDVEALHQEVLGLAHVAVQSARDGAPVLTLWSGQPLPQAVQ